MRKYKVKITYLDMVIYEGEAEGVDYQDAYEGVWQELKCSADTEMREINEDE